MALILARDVKLYVSTNPVTPTSGNTDKLLILPGYTIKQGSSFTLTSRETIDSTGSRSAKASVEEISSVDFSFSTYMRPFTDTNVNCPEANLWKGLAGTTNSFSNNPTQATISFVNSNIATLIPLGLWFEYITTGEVFFLDNVTIEKAEIIFNINEIPTIKWSGSALTLTTGASTPSNTDRTAIDTCLLNKFSTISLIRNAVTYNLALIGGRITIDNNITKYGRDKLGEMTVPVGHYTGARTMQGELEFYLKTGTDKALDLLNNLRSDFLTNNEAETILSDLTINISGTSTPRVTLDMPTTILDIPELNIQPLVSTRVKFLATEASVAAADELTVDYFN